MVGYGRRSAQSHDRRGVCQRFLRELPLLLMQIQGTKVVSQSAILLVAVQDHDWSVRWRLMSTWQEFTRHYPSSVTIVSFGFKEERFESLHRAALRYPKVRSDPHTWLTGTIDRRRLDLLFCPSPILLGQFPLCGGRPSRSAIWFSGSQSWGKEKWMNGCSSSYLPLT